MTRDLPSIPAATPLDDRRLSATGRSQIAANLPRDRSMESRRRGDAVYVILHPRCRGPVNRSLVDTLRCAEGCTVTFNVVTSGQCVTHRRRHDITRTWRSVPGVVCLPCLKSNRREREREKERKRDERDREKWRSEEIGGKRKREGLWPRGRNFRALQSTIVSIIHAARLRYIREAVLSRAIQCRRIAWNILRQRIRNLNDVVFDPVFGGLFKFFVEMALMLLLRLQSFLNLSQSASQTSTLLQTSLISCPRHFSSHSVVYSLQSSLFAIDSLSLFESSVGSASISWHYEVIRNDVNHVNPIRRHFRLISPHRCPVDRWISWPEIWPRNS